MADTNLIYPYEFEGGKKAIAAEVNGNFEAVKRFANGINATIKELKSTVSDLENKPSRNIFEIYFGISTKTPLGAYPLWTGETINNAKSLFADFWKEAVKRKAAGTIKTVESNAAYEEILKEKGQCGAFFIDELNGHIRLPKITGFLEGIKELGELGKEAKAGLPNITAQWNFQPNATDFVPTASGAGTISDNSYGYAHGQNTRGNYFNWIGLDASKSNEVYGGSETVQPASVKLPLFIQVANNTVEIGAMDTNVIAEQLNSATSELESKYNGYSVNLEEVYSKIKKDILESSPVIKEENVVVEATRFVSDYTYGDYPYKADIVIKDALEAHVPTVNFSLVQAESGNYAPVALAGNGYVRIYAKEVPGSVFIIPNIILQ